MEPQSGATAVTLILAWGAPMVLLLVVSLRFIQRRRKRARAAAARDQQTTTGGASMRRSDREITDPGRIDAILKTATICRLAFAVADEPYVVPLSFGVTDGAPRRFYFHSAPTGRKFDMLRRNPRVCFEVEGRADLSRGEDNCNWTMIYESIIGYGRLSEISDPEEKRLGLECIMRHHGAEGPIAFPDAMIARTAVIRLDVADITGKSNRPEEDAQ